MCETLCLLGAVLAAIHFGIPLLYYIHLRGKLREPWRLQIDPSYRPKITIIIPTYNEADTITKKLDNIYSLNYPRKLIDVIVVDSASTDHTPELAEEWATRHQDIRVHIIREDKRRGKLHAVLNALKYVEDDTDIILLTDADAFFQRDSLLNAVKYFADPRVGALTASIDYIVDTSVGLDENVENAYRSLYNMIRVAESKIHSTPVHNGPFQAIRSDIVRRIGLPSFPGADDSAFASYIAFAGYRAIQVDDVWVYEPHRGSTLKRKLRRAQHLTLNFLLTKRYAKKKGVYHKSVFDTIWRIEFYLHIVNPWLLLAAATALALGAVSGDKAAAALIALGVAALTLAEPARVWLVQQLYLLGGMIRNIWTRSETWTR